MSKEENKKFKKHLFSGSLFKQSLKSNWVVWLVMTLGASGIFIVVNLVVGSKAVFTNIDMNAVTQYVKDENLSWLKILGLLETMGFHLSRIQTMSQIDLNAIMNDLIYKITGVLLPMIYVMIVSNKLIVSQVSDGSMAYVLSTPTNRRKVLNTQLAFLLLSVVAMYVVITIAALGSEAISGLIMYAREGTNNKVPFRSFLYCVGSLCSMLCLAGICFGASCYFNRSAESVALGGGVCIVSFICCILGLFGNKVFVSVGIGVEAMYAFNYASVFTLIDTDSMSNFAKVVCNVDPNAVISYNWIWEDLILLAIGLVAIIIGYSKFTRKDLPL